MKDFLLALGVLLIAFGIVKIILSIIMGRKR